MLMSTGRAGMCTSPAGGVAARPHQRSLLCWFPLQHILTMQSKAGGMPTASGRPAGGTHGSAALDAPQQQPVPLQLRLIRRGEQAVACFSLLLQAALYCRSAADLTPLQHLHQAALLLLRASAFAAFTLMPHGTWLRWR